MAAFETREEAREVSLVLMEVVRELVVGIESLTDLDLLEHEDDMPPPLIALMSSSGDTTTAPACEAPVAVKAAKTLEPPPVALMTTTEAPCGSLEGAVAPEGKLIVDVSTGAMTVLAKKVKAACSDEDALAKIITDVQITALRGHLHVGPEALAKMQTVAKVFKGDKEIMAVFNTVVLLEELVCTAWIMKNQGTMKALLSQEDLQAQVTLQKSFVIGDHQHGTLMGSLMRAIQNNINAARGHPPVGPNTVSQMPSPPSTAATGGSSCIIA
eukprot:TRINITY_DN17240_c0_g1_i1.p1 TRINITY_DN17240_c0_g1~~TRINITY_DN17240_c0_g1_i1.p1  ORF type:complete len:270 (-),score=74.75 TRINITY_DN17240_c0_g1_i1:37-846(-)